MLFSSSLVRSPSPFALLRVPFAIGSIGLLLHAGPAHGADGPDLVLSLTSPGSLPGGVVEDEELLLVAGDGAVRRLVPERTLALYFDAGAAGLHVGPSDIDGLDVHAVAPGVPWMAGLHFSLVSDEGGFRDGDILRFDPSTASVHVVFAEAALVAAIAANDANIDVDAFCIEADGTLIFSLAEDESVGPGQTIILDDAVFRLLPGASAATVLYDDAAMAAAVSQALGVSTAIGDVKGLDMLDGELLFTVQSPSAHDATVFTMASGGAIFDQRTEAALGFLGEVEADALAILPAPPFPTLDLSAPAVVEGTPVTVRLEGTGPGAPFLVLISGAPLFFGGQPTSGFGVLSLDPTDPLWLAGLLNAPALFGVADPTGVGSLSGGVPIAGVAYDLYIQAVTSGARSTNPVVLEVNQ